MWTFVVRGSTNYSCPNIGMLYMISKASRSKMKNNMYFALESYRKAQGLEFVVLFCLCIDGDRFVMTCH